MAGCTRQEMPHWQVSTRGALAPPVNRYIRTNDVAVFPYSLKGVALEGLALSWGFADSRIIDHSR
jgi:hypothetical protein